MSKRSVPLNDRSIVPGSVRFEVVRAERFELVDRRGRLRGGLGFTDDGDPLLVVFDAKQRPRLTATVRADGTAGFCAQGSDGEVLTRAMLAVEADGSGTVACFDRNGEETGGLGGAPAPEPVRPKLRVIDGGRAKPKPQAEGAS